MIFGLLMVGGHPQRRRRLTERSDMPKYYFECEMGCGIRTYRSLLSARKQILREVGEINWKGEQSVRRATQVDISWVESMGGKIL